MLNFPFFNSAFTAENFTPNKLDSVPLNFVRAKLVKNARLYKSRGLSEIEI